MAGEMNMQGRRLMQEQDFREFCCDQVQESMGVVFAKLAGQLGDPFRFDPAQVEKARRVISRELATLLQSGAVRPVSTLYRGVDRTIPADLARERLSRDGFRAFLNRAGVAHRDQVMPEDSHAS